MIKRNITKTIRGHKAVDGAGVHMVRVLGYDDVTDFDPFLMLDSFDSTNPDDYTAGFPMHPHRGIETVTYLISGLIDHKDSLGNHGSIQSGEAQWMTAGGGILHEEMPKPSDRMLGFQLWLNLSSDEKMVDPQYMSITSEMIGLKSTDQGEIRVIAGEFEDAKGVVPRHIPASIYDIQLVAGAEIQIPTKSDENVFIFLIDGDGVCNDTSFPTKTAILFDEGDYIKVSATSDSPLRFIFFSGKSLKEPIAWGGPIVMNTQEELSQAFSELRMGTFIKRK